MKGHRRIHYFVKRRLQLKLTAAIVMSMLVVTIVSGVGLYFSIWSSVVENFSAINVSSQLENAKRISAYSEARFKSTDSRLARIFSEADLLSDYQMKQLTSIIRESNASLVPKLILLALLISVLSIFLSHKIAGPVVHFENSAKAMSEGDLTTSFHLRKDDQLVELSEILERMKESFRKTVSDMAFIIDKDSLSDKDKLSRIREEIAKYKV